LDASVTMVGFLHTSEVHVATFRALLARHAPQLEAVDTVDQTLLDEARTRGIDADIRQRLATRLLGLHARGAAVVVCTCSTLGAVAEQLTDSVGVPVIRVDRPMAERAAEIGGRIAVVVAVASTLGPTRGFLVDCIAESPRDSTLIESPCVDAWTLFESGDTEGYLDRVAAHARQTADHADVIVLAQASMAGAADWLTDLPIPVLTSPSTAVQHAAALAQS
jgi:Asp/Glu/hydantoin racemase